jgi:hypothetical protein
MMLVQKRYDSSVMQIYFFAYRNESGTFFYTRKIVVKVILFCIILFHLSGDDCQSIPIFFVIFHKSF